MKKTSAYARKRRAMGLHAQGYAGANQYAWLRAIKTSRPYDDESILDEVPTAEVADKAIINARLTLKLLAEGTVQPDDTDQHDLMAHVIGMAQIRTLDMGGDGADAVMDSLNTAAEALQRCRERWEKLGKWGLDGPGLVALREAIDIYEAILRASSPQQMENAQMVRLDQVKRLQGVQP
jgi:hypothetical protein